MVVSCPIYHFWSQILWSPTERIGGLLSQHLCQAEVSQFNVAVLADQDVFRLQVPIEDLAFVEVAEGQGDLSPIEFGGGFGKFFVLGQDSVELSASYEIHEKVDP